MELLRLGREKPCDMSASLRNFTPGTLALETSHYPGRSPGHTERLLSRTLAELATNIHISASFVNE